MAVRVCKFGGSSVSGAEMFARVRKILEAEPARRFIVLSAPGRGQPWDDKMTDLLYAAHSAKDPEDQLIFSRIAARYTSIRDRLGLDYDLERELAAIRSRLHSTPDFAASRGEYLCARLFSAYTKIPFVDASELILFGSDGLPDAKEIRRAARERLLPLERAVIPGFYGSMPDGAIRTFTRGGSDVSGALLAAAIEADLYENWTDVDGLFTADPNLLSDARRHRRVSYRQMQALSAAGARVLHQDCLKPLIGKNIDTVLKNTFAPDAPGTRITESFDAAVFCVTGRRSLFFSRTPPFSDTDADGLPLRLSEADFPNAQRVSEISVFTPEAASIREMLPSLKPLSVLSRTSPLRLLVDCERFEAYIRSLHRAVLLQAPEKFLR